MEPTKKNLQMKDADPYGHDPRRLPSQLERLTPEREILHAMTFLEERVRILRKEGLRPEEVTVLEDGITAMKSEEMPSHDFIVLIEKLQKEEAQMLQSITEKRIPPAGEDDLVDRFRAHLTMYTALLQKIRGLGESH